ncbi:phage shock protein A [Paenibacillus sacheonensis]|nr:phage shock protein A [Paenibacillus sacheonensis]
MKANMHGLLDKADDPERAVNAYMQRLSSDLGGVKAETASVLLEVDRARRALDECRAEIKKLQRYAEKSAESGDDDRALQFLAAKSKQTEQLDELQVAHDRASAKAALMKQMQDKLVSDLSQLEARHAELKGKMAEAKTQQHVNGGNRAADKASASFDALEEKANQALNEAMALAELRGGTEEDDLDALIAQAQLAKEAEGSGGRPGSAEAAPISAEEELAAIKERLRSR